MESGKVTVVALLLCLSVGVIAEDPYLYFNWNVTYGTVSPLGVPQQGILINGQFPGPRINCTSNNNIVVNVFNNLDEPFLFTWNGVQHRKNSWQDGTPGTMCPIMPGQNFTYRFQVKDQIGSYYYFPTTALHRAAGGYGAINVHSRALIPVPFDNPADEYNVFVGDWYNKGHKTLKKVLDGGHTVGRPDGIIINGKSAKVGEAKEPLFTMEAGKTYRYRFCNLGMRSSVNVRFQGHPMKLVELEGSHTVQNIYDSLDIHVGQCLSVLVTANQEPKDYYLVVSSRFLKQELSSVAIIRYANGKGPASPELPASPPDNTEGIAWSMNQFRSFRWNLTASAARPNPQGSYHYGQINITRTIKIVNSMGQVNGKLRYGLNGISHSDTETPLKLVEYFGAADKSFKYDLMADEAPADPSKLTVAPNVKNTTYRNFMEIIFENHEKSIRTYHLDGYSFFAVAVEPGRWSAEKRKNYNLVDATSRNNIQVYPNSWAAIMLTFDNAGMWNLRSEMWEEDYNRLRPLSYRGADVFILAFSLISKASYENVSKKWIPELRHYAPGVPIILVGTKLDLREDKQFFVDHPGAVPLSTAQGEELRKSIGAAAYIECSAKTQQNIKAVFDAAIKVVLQPPKQKKKKKRKGQKACSIL